MRKRLLASRARMNIIGRFPIRTETCSLSSGDFPMKTKSRRHFLKSAAVSGAGLFAARSLPACARSTENKPIVPPISIFGYSNVQLLDGPFRTQFDQNHQLFLHLDEDGML